MFQLPTTEPWGWRVWTTTQKKKALKKSLPLKHVSFISKSVAWGNRIYCCYFPEAEQSLSRALDAAHWPFFSNWGFIVGSYLSIFAGYLFHIWPITPTKPRTSFFIIFLPYVPFSLSSPYFISSRKYLYYHPNTLHMYSLYISISNLWSEPYKTSTFPLQFIFLLYSSLSSTSPWLSQSADFYNNLLLSSFIQHKVSLLCYDLWRNITCWKSGFSCRRHMFVQAVLHSIALYYKTNNHQWYLNLIVYYSHLISHNKARQS